MNARMIKAVASFASVTALSTVFAAGCGASPGTEGEGTSTAELSKDPGGPGTPGGPVSVPVKENCGYQAWTAGDPYQTALQQLGCQQPELALATDNDYQPKYWNLSICPVTTTTTFNCFSTGQNVTGNVLALNSCYVAIGGMSTQPTTCSGAEVPPETIGVLFDPNCDNGCKAPTPPVLHVYEGVRPAAP